MASGVDRPGYRQVSDETHATSKIVPSGWGVEECPHPAILRGEYLESVLDNNSLLTSISDDSVFPALDGDTPSLARSYTPLPSADQLTSRHHVCESSNLVGITGNPTNVKKNEVQVTSVNQQKPVCPSTPDDRHSSFRHNSPSTLNDNRLFGNGTEHFDGGDIQPSHPVGQTSCPNVFSATNDHVSPPISQICASSDQDVSFSTSYVPSAASHSLQFAQTTRMMTPISPTFSPFEPPSSHWNVAYPPQSAQITGPRVPLWQNVPPIRSGVPSPNWGPFRPPFGMQTSRLSLPSNQGVPSSWLDSPYIGPAVSSTSDEHYQHQRTSAFPNSLSAYGNVSQNAETVFISEQGNWSMGVSAQQSGQTTLTRPCPLSTGNLVNIQHQLADEPQVIIATDDRGHEYKLSRQRVDKPELAQYGARLESFVKWPCHYHITPQQAASAGLYLGDEGYTRCFACSGGLDQWQPGDEAFKEHAKFYKTCPYVNAIVMERYLETAGATGSSQIFNRCYIQLVQMGFPPNRVKLAIQRTVEKYGQEQFGLDELLDDLMKTSGEETSEDDPEISPSCMNDITKNCAVS